MSENETWPKCPNGEHHLVLRTVDGSGIWYWYCTDCRRINQHLGGIPAAPPAPRWIPVSERLPVAEEWYVVRTSELPSSWCRIKWNDGQWRTFLRVTHWLDWQPPPPPLPEPDPEPEKPPGVRYERTGEFRAPRRGEWYESGGARPLQAEEDWTGSRWILRRVEVPS